MPPHRPPTPDNPDNPPAPRDGEAERAPRFVVDSDQAHVLSVASGRDASLAGTAGRGVTVTLDAGQSRHALRALRLSAGDAVRLLDGRGAVAHARICEHAPGRVVCSVESIERVAGPTPRVIVATAIPKGPRGDAMSNDLAQLGADVLVPMTTSRSVVVPGASKLARYHKQAVEAAKQCGRAWFMEVAPLTGFERVIADPTAAGGAGEPSLKLLADPSGEPTSALASRLADASSVVVLVGPEGGFSAEEARAARDAGFVPWRFGEHILRVETAAAGAVAVLRALA